jgi:hypothetical protein
MFSPSTSVSPANLHSTNFSIIIITRGRYNRPFTQLGLHSRLWELKENAKKKCPNLLKIINHKDQSIRKDSLGDN